jgi:hypothetical protein
MELRIEMMLVVALLASPSANVGHWRLGLLVFIGYLVLPESFVHNLGGLSLAHEVISLE